MRANLPVIVVVSSVLALCCARGGAATPAIPAGDVGVEYFERHIRPLLVEHCYKCHSADATKLKGGLYLDTQDGWMNGGESGPAITPGKPNESRLIHAVRYGDKDLQMPPKYRLKDEEIARLEQWVAMGAPDPRHKEAAPLPGAAVGVTQADIEAGRAFWAFAPLTQPKVPAVKDAAWPRGDIDRFVLAGMEAKGIKPVADADRRVLIRRLYFDLIGLPPTPDEVAALVADTDPRAVEKLVDELLAKPEFGERWGRHWLDVARYAESTGQTRNYPYGYAWRYRDYVIASLNADKPYDVFVREQIAGDLMPADSPRQRDERLIATGYLAMGSKDLNERNKLQFDIDNVDEQLDTIGRGVLALTVSCARCHDHKFDPIPTSDYYALAGVFKSTDVLFGLGLRKGNKNAFSPDQMLKLTHAPGKGGDDAADGGSEKQLQRQIAQLNEQIDEADRRRRQAGNDDEARQDAQRDLNRLADEMDELRKKLQGMVALAMGVKDGERPHDLRVMIRGDIDNLGEPVKRGVLRVLADDSMSELSSGGSGRLEVAEWLTSDKTPAGQLAARVMVNRIWSHLFGRGIVPTVDNFGAMGLKPTHPELLDHLAGQFIASGWSIKRTIRGVVLSRAYQLSSEHSERNYDVDPANELLWRSSPRRIEAEALRDAMLAVSGQLDRTPGSGSPVTALPAAEIRRDLDEFVQASRQRTVYLPIVRSMLPEMLETFDFGEPSGVVGQRDVTTVAPQALLLMNSEFVTEQAGAFAWLLLEREGLDDFGRIELAYEKALSRKPTSEERQRAMAYLDDFAAGTPGISDDNMRRAAWASFCQALFACAEFRYLN